MVMPDVRYERENGSLQSEKKELLNGRGMGQRGRGGGGGEEEEEGDEKRQQTGRKMNEMF